MHRGVRRASCVQARHRHLGSDEVTFPRLTSSDPGVRARSTRVISSQSEILRRSTRRGVSDESGQLCEACE